MYRKMTAVQKQIMKELSANHTKKHMEKMKYAVTRLGLCIQDAHAYAMKHKK
jgi:hypothetical protein